MRLTRIANAVISCLIVAATGCGGESTDTQEQEALQLVRDYIKSDERRDLEGVRATWLQDETVTVIGTSANIQLLGWSQIEARLMKVYPLTSDEKLNFSGEFARIYGAGVSAVVVVPKVDVDITIGGNHIVASGTRQTYTLERRDGAWKIVHEHWSVPQ